MTTYRTHQPRLPLREHQPLLSVWQPWSTIRQNTINRPPNGLVHNGTRYWFSQSTLGGAADLKVIKNRQNMMAWNRGQFGERSVMDWETKILVILLAAHQRHPLPPWTDTKSQRKDQPYSRPKPGVHTCGNNSLLTFGSSLANTGTVGQRPGAKTTQKLGGGN